MTVLLCFGLDMPAGPTGVVKSEIGADMLGFRSRMAAVVVAILIDGFVHCDDNLGSVQKRQFEEEVR